MRLKIQLEFDKSLDLVITKNSSTLGRDANCDLVVPHPSISRQHCQIEVTKEIIQITDLGSSNGTFIDGKRLQPQQRTVFFSTQELILGKVSCEVIESASSVEHKTRTKIVAPSKGDATATARINRQEIVPPSPQSFSEVIQKKHKLKGPRNPVTDELQQGDIEVVESKRTYIILFVIILIILLWLLQPIFLSSN
jgi:pSer/pThr/pTyr-binding forkhead associated (FHA) protein